MAHSSRRNFFAWDDSRSHFKFSLLHFFLVSGKRNARVNLGGYVMVTSPLISGSLALGYPNGYVGFCHKKVG